MQEAESLEVKLPGILHIPMQEATPESLEVRLPGLLVYVIPWLLRCIVWVFNPTTCMAPVWHQQCSQIFHGKEVVGTTKHDQLMFHKHMINIFIHY